jgi:hypothetical protein
VGANVAVTDAVAATASSAIRQEIRQDMQFLHRRKFPTMAIRAMLFSFPPAGGNPAI